jgi:hypothetical protein
MTDDRPTRDQRATMYAQGLRDVARAVPVSATVTRVQVVDDTARSQLPSGSPLVGFSETIAAVAGQHGALAILAPTARGGAVIESVFGSSEIAWTNVAQVGAPFSGAVAAPYRANLPAAIPGRSDPNSGIEFQGLVFAAGTGVAGGEHAGWDVIARRGTVSSADPAVLGPRFSTGYHRIEWVLEPGIWFVIASVAPNLTVTLAMNVRVPLVPTPLAR